MLSRRRLLAAGGAAVVAGCGSGPDERTATEDDGSGGYEPLVVRPSGFEDEGTIPRKYTGVGDDVSPPMTVENVPAKAETLAIVLDDPDANEFLHWLIWNVPADTDEIPEGIPQSGTVDSLGGARQGTNDFGEVGYRGPLPPEGDAAHTYQFTTYAVDTSLELAAGADRGELDSALDGHVIDRYPFVATFER
ncbi:hypothetical protein C475_13577 [Halosimplex carlsbadense 2-9-1]|uniref:YbhB/YbcL family Raf kinase inhibitor-like protein n=1 Tax=Halosimplex carlsbadense 2-9-1 TaxID=797114 RepID=M0CNR3_9EURY|nr:YbhB/YbcL family Raf kinase inhibitor-like protein [Halosimplex carlsbadense]ELZ24283.1 hypothetical protein C475_13577 [Halosimplex carlsbadense 2-9-1]